MADQRLHVNVEAHQGEQPYELHVEPWGSIFDIEPGSPAVTTFIGPTTPSISISHGSNFVVVCAEAGIDDYRVEDMAGAEITRR